ncbi:MAG: haloacid dehalogenase-like hydrolase [Firmicutes bacterium ADurb.Bin193]|nr:MAG: haloacid dehalogenase-like hydrolase [Firmicutes bacterium ADurb.Bin193]
MANLQPFLDKYKVILFDMDGVITSEQGYWNCAALTVHEMLRSSHCLGSEDFNRAAAVANLENVRKAVFANGKTIALLKEKGVNSNWDLAYVVICISLILGNTSDYEAVYRYAQGLGDDILSEYDRLAGLAAKALGRPPKWSERLGEMWTQQQKLFQLYYIGTDEFDGLIQNEMPIIPLPELYDLLSSLCEAGKQLGYGTGRLAFETLHPLRLWHVDAFFAPQRRICYDEVINAEERLAAAGRNVRLTKPHPYMFLQGLYGLDYPPEKLIDGDYDKSAIAEVLVVGDAGADIYAAQAMGADFCAVLTGVAGQAARGYFEGVGAQYILDSVRDMMTSE